MSWGSGGRFTIGSTITLKLDAAVLRSTSSNGEICMSIRENAMHRSQASLRAMSYFIDGN